ncbi:MAG: prepilin-type N-terminal cleavage/methylation domain-containing protein [Aquificaceae bacterium]
MYGKYRGFTLLEVLIALFILSVGFGVLFEAMSKARRDYEHDENLCRDLLILNNKILTQDRKDIEIKEHNLNDYPSVREIVYSYRRAIIYQYTLKR